MSQISIERNKSHLKDALLRQSQRRDTDKIPEKGVLAKYQRLELPSWSEGFDQIFYVSIDPVTSQFQIRIWEDEVR